MIFLSVEGTERKISTPVGINKESNPFLDGLYCFPPFYPANSGAQRKTIKNKHQRSLRLGHGPARAGQAGVNNKNVKNHQKRKVLCQRIK